jgi:hypothetical protein
MKKITFFLIFILSINGVAFATPITVNESIETLVFDFPKESSKEWKELTRIHTATERAYEYIPSDQEEGNWSELIAVQYFDRFSMNKKAANSVDGFIETYREQLAKSYPGNEVTFRIIEKNEFDAIYEWILHKRYNSIRPQHEIARAFLTNTGFHRIGITYQDHEMNRVERDKWIKFLKENVWIRTKQKVENAKCSSSKSENLVPLDLGPEFKDWKLINSSSEDGLIINIRVPPWLQEIHYAGEFLEVTFSPIAQSIPLDELFKIEQKAIKTTGASKADFNIIKKAPKEIVYHYACHFLKNKLIITGVCRSIVTEKGYFHMHYKRGLPFQPPKEEMFQWQERLEKIQVR